MKNLLKKIIATPELYGRFLNTLSMMEYVGARKIIKSQQQENINERLLNHVAQEIQHALIIKHAAKKCADNLCDSYVLGGLLCGLEAYHYFQAVDHATQRELENQANEWYAYIYTTVIMKTRGILVYSLLDEVLQEMGKPKVFDDIVTEQQCHLNELAKIMHTLPNFDLTVARVRNIEEKEFTVFLQALGGAVEYQEELTN
jgi:hypothetical protein